MKHMQLYYGGMVIIVGKYAQFAVVLCEHKQQEHKVAKIQLVQ